MVFIVSSHAITQMKLRGIEETVLRSILNQPDQVIKQEDKTIYQSVVNETGGTYLIRVFVNHLKIPNMVITVYKTSKIEKYYEGNL